MNAVEAVEQLGVMGRRLQAREVGLQQPSLRLQKVLRQTANWEKVLGDPVAVLSQVLGAAGAGQLRAKEAESAPDEPVAYLPVAPFRWEEDRPPAGSEISSWRSGSGRTQGGAQSGAPAVGSEPRVESAASVRLARRQTSLLGILNANLENRATAEPDAQGRAAALTGDGRPEGRTNGLWAGQDDTPADPRGPLARWGAVPVEPGEGAVSWPFAGPAEVRQSSERATLLASGLRQEEAEFGDGVGALLTRQRGSNSGPDGERTAEMSVGGHDSLPQHEHEAAVRPEERLGAEGGRELTRRTEAGRDGERVALPSSLHGQVRSAGQAGDWGDWQHNTDIAPPAPDGVWAAANDTQGERPLSLAQIEQVLAALDERLELMLLRMYGAAGGLP
jgi:hypothetical protein